jgi:hypothetical protein
LIVSIHTTEEQEAKENNDAGKTPIYQDDRNNIIIDVPPSRILD